MKLPRVLDPVEVRIIGALMEKEQTTPDAYPLSLNSLLAACNQKSNRTPVMQLDAADVRAAIERLRTEVFVWPVDGARVQRWRHAVDRKWGLDPARKAVMTVLLLRGPQTSGEIRSRSERMHPFRGTADVEEVLLQLAEGEDALVVHLQRQPGQKEARWMHLVGGIPSIPAAEFVPSGPPEPGVSERLRLVEERLDEMERRLEKLASSMEES